MRQNIYSLHSVYSLPRVCGVAALSAERLEILVEVCAVDDRVDAAVEHRRQQHDVRHQGPNLHTVQWQHDGDIKFEFCIWIKSSSCFGTSYSRMIALQK